MSQHCQQSRAVHTGLFYSQSVNSWKCRACPGWKKRNQFRLQMSRPSLRMDRGKVCICAHTHTQVHSHSHSPGLYTLACCLGSPDICPGSPDICGWRPRQRTHDVLSGDCLLITTAAPALGPGSSTCPRGASLSRVPTRC